MKTDDAYSVDSILQKFMEKIPLDSLTEPEHKRTYVVVNTTKRVYAADHLSYPSNVEKCYYDYER